jgi:hypothetical protein
MQIVYVMEVIDPFERPRGARYVRRFTYETREQAWARYSEAIRFGFEAYVEEVGRMRVTTQTTAHEDLGRSSVRPGAHLATAPSPNDAAAASAGTTAAAMPSASRDRRARSRPR